LKASNAISSKTGRAVRSSADSSSSPAEKFTLSGPSILLDPAIHAYRSDIADIALAGSLFAPHYARPLIRTALSAVPVRDGDSDTADIVAKLAPGDEFAILDIAGGWAWGYVRATHRVGYVENSALTH